MSVWLFPISCQFDSSPSVRSAPLNAGSPFSEDSYCEILYQETVKIKFRYRKAHACKMHCLILKHKIIAPIIFLRKQIIPDYYIVSRIPLVFKLISVNSQIDVPNIWFGCFTNDIWHILLNLMTSIPYDPYSYFILYGSTVHTMKYDTGRHSGGKSNVVDDWQTCTRQFYRRTQFRIGV